MLWNFKTLWETTRQRWIWNGSQPRRLFNYVFYQWKSVSSQSSKETKKEKERNQMKERRRLKRKSKETLTHGMSRSEGFLVLLTNFTEQRSINIAWTDSIHSDPLSAVLQSSGSSQPDDCMFTGTICSYRTPAYNAQHGREVHNGALPAAVFDQCWYLIFHSCNNSSTKTVTNSTNRENRERLQRAKERHQSEGKWKSGNNSKTKRMEVLLDLQTVVEMELASVLLTSRGFK